MDGRVSLRHWPRTDSDDIDQEVTWMTGSVYGIVQELTLIALSVKDIGQELTWMSVS
jgi:hypothetical protein